MTTQTQGVSFNPDNFSEGGAIATGPQRIVGSVIQMFDYGQKAPPSIGLMLTMKGDDGRDSTQFYSAGDPTRWEASPDGQQLLPRTPGQEITKSCNLGWFMTELINAGYDQNKLRNNAGDFVGLYAMFEEKAQPKREGLTQTDEAGGQRRKPTSAIPVKVLQMPGEAATPIAPGGVPAGAPPVAVAPPVAAAPIAVAPPAAAPVPAPVTPVTPATAVVPVPPPNGATDPSVIGGKLIGILEATAGLNGGSMTMQGVMATLWGPQGLANDPDKDAVMAMIGDPIASGPFLAAAGITQTGDNFVKA